MRKGLPSMQIVNGRWRGIMPFRQSPDRKLLEQQRRTGEPSPALDFPLREWKYPDGYGKARGSYTERMRQSLWEWISNKYKSSLAPITFEYRLYRHKRITVVGVCPYIKHLPSYGKGKKGFILQINVQSIDGISLRRLGKHQHFAWDRIIGKERFLALPVSTSRIENKNLATLTCQWCSKSFIHTDIYSKDIDKYNKGGAVLCPHCYRFTNPNPKYHKLEGL